MKTITDVEIAMDDGVVLVGDVSWPADLQTGERAPGTFPVIVSNNPYTCDSSASSPALASVDPDTFITRWLHLRPALHPWDRPVRRRLPVVRPARAEGHHQHRLLGGRQGGPVGEGARGLQRQGRPVRLLLPRHRADAPRLADRAKLAAEGDHPFCAGTELYREAVMGWGMPTQTGTAFLSAAIPALSGPRAAAWSEPKWADIFAGSDSAYDRQLYNEREQAQAAEGIVRNGIPALLWTGYADIFPGGAQEMYAFLQNAWAGRPTFGAMKPGQRVTGRYQVVVGPWGHADGIDGLIELEWFDTWLKGMPTRMDKTATPMHLWDATAQHWLNAASYPQVSRYTPLYLDDGGKLSEKKPTAEGAHAIAWGQPSAGNELTFTSEPLKAGGTLAGPIAASLYASSSSTNLELIAKVLTVDPAGVATKLGSGFVIGSLRRLDPGRTWNDEAGQASRPYCFCDKDEYLEPGQVEKFEFHVLPRVATIPPGHSIQVKIATQTPEHECGTGAPIGLEPCTPTAPQAQTLPGTYQVLRGPATPSAINVPLLPHRAFPDTGRDASPLDWGDLRDTPAEQQIAQKGFSARLAVPARLDRRFARRNGLRARVSCSAACRTTLRVTVSRATARRLGLKSTTLGRATARRAAGGTSLVRVRFTRAARLRLTRRGSLSMSVTARIALSAAGAPVRLSKGVRLVR